MHDGGVWSLRITAGAAVGTSRPLDARTVIGRGAVDLDTRDGAVSRTHAAVFIVSGRPVIEDLGSAGGTAVGGRRIDAPTALSAGSTIEVGSTRLLVLRHDSVVRLEDGTALRMRRPGTPAHPLPGGAALVVGRDAGCDVRIDAPSVSRRHARIERRGATWLVEDLGSSNGTTVNGRRITTPTTVDVGDVVGIGDAAVEVVAPGAIEDPIVCSVTVEGEERTWAVEVATSPTTTVAEVAAALTDYVDAPRGSWLYRSAGVAPHPESAWLGAGIRQADRLVLAAPPAVDGAHGVEAARSPTTVITSMPRQVRAPGVHQIEPPRSPDPVSLRGRGLIWQVAAGSASLLAAAAIAIIRPAYAVFALIGGMIGLIAIAASILGEQSRRRFGVSTFRADIAALDAELSEVTAAQATALRELWPPPADLLTWISNEGDRLWERRAADDDAAVLRIGVGSRPALVEERSRVRRSAAYDDEITAVLRRRETLHDVPITVPRGVTGLLGDRNAVDDLARWLVLQAAALHAPGDLEIAVVAVDRSWEWARWLPHVRRATGPLVSRSSDEARDVLAALSADSDDRALPQDAPRRRRLVVLGRGAATLDGAVELAGSAWRDRGAVIAVAESAASLPPGMDAVVDVSGREAQVRAVDVAGTTGRVLIDGIDLATAESAARELGGFSDPRSERGRTQAARGALQLLGFVDAASLDVERSWSTPPSPPLTVTVGVEDGGVPAALGFRVDGPHGMIAGTTGSGKSELLQTLLTGLVLRHPPSMLNLFLIDFKGGATFAPFTGLPHVVGVVTDIEQDTTLAARAFTSLESEITRRKRLLDAARVPDLASYEELPESASAPVPSLVVVIDEFALLVKELPDTRERLDLVATQGRSLGVHLLLATQSPSGVISHAIRTNTNLWICLRVVDESESTEILGKKDAARIPGDQPGRGYVRRGAAEMITGFQAARIARPLDDTATTSVLVRPWADDRPAGSSPRPTEPRARARRLTELDAACDAVRKAAAALPAPTTLWLPPLPTELAPETLERAGDDDRLVIAVGLADDPANHRQGTWSVDLSAAGNLLVLGRLGSGKTTTLRQVAAELGERHTPDEVHLYAIDAGAGSLGPLAALPHCAGVIGVGDDERLQRVFARLAREVDDRRAAMSDAGAADFLAWRRTTGTPWIVLIVDDYPALKEASETRFAGELGDRLASLAQSGPSVGVHVVLATTQAADLRIVVTNLFPARVLLRQVDVVDYQLLGLRLRPGQEPDSRPGRALVEGGLQVQVAHRAAERVEPRRGSGGPRPVQRLPRLVRSSELPDMVAPGPDAVLLGLGGADIDPVWWRPSRGEPHLLVLGDGQSGRSSLLRTLVDRVGGPTVVLAPRPSPLWELAPRPELVVARSAGELDEAMGHLGSRDADGTFLLIDDAETLAGAADRLEPVLRDARTRHIRSVVAARTGDLPRLFDGWSRYLLSLRNGILLMPQPDAGHLFEVRLPRTTIPMVEGRGYVITAGIATLTQLAIADDLVREGVS